MKLPKIGFSEVRLVLNLGKALIYGIRKKWKARYLCGNCPLETCKFGHEWTLAMIRKCSYNNPKKESE